MQETPVVTYLIQPLAAHRRAVRIRRARRGLTALSAVALLLAPTPVSALSPWHGSTHARPSGVHACVKDADRC